MRARDSRHRADELAAVVRWLRARAGEAMDASEAMRGKYGPTGERLAADCKAKAAAFYDAAGGLERGEHHGQG